MQATRGMKHLDLATNYFVFLDFSQVSLSRAYGFTGIFHALQVCGVVDGGGCVSSHDCRADHCLEPVNLQLYLLIKKRLNESIAFAFIECFSQFDHISSQSSNFSIFIMLLSL